ncbi:MAG: hypothetical protein ISN26_02770, partial [Betaproteobacteria bacterium AqS2]|nr:hypothetical protein [Betaproteobacteria bacterium AqS2]
AAPPASSPAAAPPPAPAAAPAAPAAANAGNQAALINELEAAQSRIRALERDTRSLLGIVEDLGSEVREGGGGGTSPQQLRALRLELIDLRLRLDGDTFAASAALEQLGLLAGKGTQLGLLIDANRLRLASILPRAQLLEMADGLIRQARAARDGARAAAAAYGSGAGGGESLLGQLFTVRRSSPALEEAHARHDELLAAATGLRTRLLLQDEQGYLEDLATIQRLLRELRAAAAGTVELAAMAKAAGDLAAAGYPAYRLQLEQQ